MNRVRHCGLFEWRPLIRNPLALDVLNFKDADAELIRNLDSGLLGLATIVLKLD